MAQTSHKWQYIFIFKLILYAVLVLTKHYNIVEYIYI